MDKPLKGPDFPQKPDRVALYQKLALLNWKERIADERKRSEAAAAEDAANDTPDSVHGDQNRQK